MLCNLFSIFYFYIWDFQSSSLNPNLQFLYGGWLMLVSRTINLSSHVKIFVVNDKHLFVVFVLVRQLDTVWVCLELFGYSWFQFLVINTGRGQHNSSVGVMAFNFKFPSMICWHSAIQGCLRRVGAGTCCCDSRCRTVGMSDIGRLAVIFPQLSNIDATIRIRRLSTTHCAVARVVMSSGCDGRNRRDGRL